MSKGSLIMARPPSIDTAELLAAARRLFLERGADVSTAEIARAAGVSEGSLYKRFPTKRDLFLAAMGLPGGPPWMARLADLPGRGDPQANLRRLVLDLVAFFREHLPRIMLVWSHCRCGEAPDILRGRGSPPARGLDAVAAYLAAEHALGRIHAPHPEEVARALIGAAWHRVFFELIGVARGRRGRPRAFARKLVASLWEGIAPRAPAPGVD